PSPSPAAGASSAPPLQAASARVATHDNSRARVDVVMAQRWREPAAVFRLSRAPPPRVRTQASCPAPARLRAGARHFRGLLPANALSSGLQRRSDGANSPW